MRKGVDAKEFKNKVKVTIFPSYIFYSTLTKKIDKQHIMWLMHNSIAGEEKWPNIFD
jgi:hypothetical protein